MLAEIKSELFLSCFALRKRIKDEDKEIHLQEQCHPINNFMKWYGSLGSSGPLTLYHKAGSFSLNEGSMQ